MAILKSYAKGRNTRTLYLSIPEKTTKTDIDDFLEILSIENDYEVVYRDRKTPFSPVVKKEMLQADEFGIAVTSALTDKNNRTLKEDIPFLLENGKKPLFMYLREEDSQYRTYLNKVLYPSQNISEEERDKVYELLDKAKDLLDMKKYREAMLSTSEAMEILHATGPESDVEQIHLAMRGFITSASIMFASGQVAGAREQYREASHCMTKILTEDNYADVIQFLGEAYAQLLDFLIREGSNEEALEYSNQALEAINLMDHEIYVQEAHILSCKAIALSRLGKAEEAQQVLRRLDRKLNDAPPYIRAIAAGSYQIALGAVNAGKKTEPTGSDSTGKIRKSYEAGNQLFLDMQWTKAIQNFDKALDVIEHPDGNENDPEIRKIMVDIHVKKAYAYCKSRSKKNTSAALRIAYEDLKEYRSEMPGYQDLDHILLCVHSAVEYASNADCRKWITLLDHAFTNLLKKAYLNDVPEDDRVWATLEDARNQLNDYLYN